MQLLYMARTRPQRRTFRKTHIRAFRKDRQRTLEDLADEIGSTHATLSRIERGKLPYSQDIIEKLAHSLRTTPGKLIDGPLE